MAGHKIWTAGNDGSGSGLDADKLDGLHATNFARIGTTSPPNNYLFVRRSSSAATLYVNQFGSGDIARFVKGSNGHETEGGVSVVIGGTGSITASGEISSKQLVTANNPLNHSAGVSLGWDNNAPRLRVGGSGTGAESPFSIRSTSDRNMLEVTTEEAYIGLGKNKAWHTGNDSTLRGLKLTNYKNITVGGDANTYYPVLITGSVKYMFGHFSINRGYNDVAPDSWNTASHKGGLTFDFYWSGDSGWGGNDHDLRVIQFSETYTTMVGGMVLATSGLVVWLRGGGAVYRIHSEAGNQLDATAHIGTYTASNGSNFAPRTNTSNVRGEIYSRWPVRTDGKLAVVKGMSVGPDNKEVINGENTWYRAHGDEGIYFTTHGGGLHMTDSTWVRTYAGKAFYSSSTDTLKSINTDGGIRFKHQLYNPNPTGEGGIVGNYKELGTGVEQMIWTIGTDWRTHSTHYGMGYKFGSGVGGRTEHSITFKNGGTIYTRIGFQGSATFAKKIYAADFVATSDRRIKADIKPIENALDKVMKLSGNTYIRTDLENTASTGVIAQEVEAVLPEAVVEEDDVKRVSYNGVVAMLVEAVKELTAKVKVLEAR
ncbi:tail fiber domain-containing protein [Pseudoalteromonas sp. GB43]